MWAALSEKDGAVFCICGELFLEFVVILWRNWKNTMVEQHSFVIPIASLREKVEKNTSVIGKHRSAEGEAHLMEQYAMTQGEDFLFGDYLRDAAAKTYNFIKAFGRNVKDAYRVYHNVVPRLVTEHDGFYISLNGVRVGDKRAIVHLNDDMYDIDHIEGEEEYHINVHMPHLLIHKGESVSYCVEIRIGYSTIADGVFVDQHEYRKTLFAGDNLDIEDFTAVVNVSQAEFPTAIRNVHTFAVAVSGANDRPTVYHAGEFIKFIHEDGTVKYGVQNETSTKLVVDEWFDWDITESVVFKVELLDWQDRNMLPAAQEHLEDALLNYIMYRWFKMIKPDVATLQGGKWRKEASLADEFYANWEEHAHAAQMALNSENRILQRKSTWL